MVFGMVAMIIGIAAVTRSSAQREHPFSASAALFTVGILIFTIIIAVSLTIQISKYNLRREFAKRPDANMEILWILSAAGIQTKSTNLKAELNWPVFQKIISAPAGFIFMPNSQIFHFIPIRAFSSAEDIENLKTLAREHAAVFKELK